jgi:raffinose/stachyose/melibiose transport system substrate-binding protein
MANKPRWPGTHWWSELVAQSCGPDFVQQVTDGAASFDDPCVVKAHGHIQELVDAGAFNEGFNGLDYDPGESRQLFWSGKAAMNHMGNWTVGSAARRRPRCWRRWPCSPCRRSRTRRCPTPR